MNIYSKSANDMFASASRALLQHGTKPGNGTIETLNATLMALGLYPNVITAPVRKFSRRGAAAEILWYMSANDNVSAVTPYLKNWAQFADKNGRVRSCYGVYWKEQYKKNVVEELATNTNSRRAVITAYSGTEDRDAYIKDTPCTLSWQFMIRERDGKKCLDMVVNMRSNDVWWGLCIDQFCNTCFHRLMLNELRKYHPDLVMGIYFHNASSLHVYTDAFSKVSREMLRQAAREYEPCVERVDFGELSLSDMFAGRYDKDRVAELFAPMFGSKESAMECVEHFDKLAVR